MSAMGEVDRFLERFPDYVVSDLQLASARYLEQNTKLRFMVEFGFENAPDIAFEHLESLPYDYPMGHA